MLVWNSLLKSQHIQVGPGFFQERRPDIWSRGEDPFGWPYGVTLYMDRRLPSTLIQKYFHYKYQIYWLTAPFSVMFHPKARFPFWVPQMTCLKKKVYHHYGHSRCSKTAQFLGIWVQFLRVSIQHRPKGLPCLGHGWQCMALKRHLGIVLNVCIMCVCACVWIHMSYAYNYLITYHIYDIIWYNWWFQADLNI